METEGQYPKKVCVSIWGDKINENHLKPGTMLTISFDVESREYNGRWYTDVKAWRVEPAGSGNTASSGPIDQPHFEEGQMEEKDDLPF